MNRATDRSPVPSSLGRHARGMQDAVELSPSDKREIGRHYWSTYGALVVMPGWAPALIWSACVAIAERLFGKRGL